MQAERESEPTMKRKLLTFASIAAPVTYSLWVRPTIGSIVGSLLFVALIWGYPFTMTRLEARRHRKLLRTNGTLA
jgi:hypothetical protein